jgi:putative DNA primase/helicase
MPDPFFAQARSRATTRALRRRHKTYGSSARHLARLTIGHGNAGGIVPRIAWPVPTSIRFNAGLKHPSGGVWPALVALVTSGVDGKPVGIHRTYLAPNGTAKAPVEPAKMMLGPCRGGAVRLGPIGGRVMIAEGIETALSAMQVTGQTAWAALSTSGLRNLELPTSVRDVVVLADGDNPGEAAARDCAWRWKREGRRVRIARPPTGMDFNDVLMHRAPCIEQAAR